MTINRLAKFLICSISLSYPAQAQVSATLSVNNINASFTANGGLFQNEYLFSGFTINDANLKAAIFAGSTWLGAMVNDSLRTAVQDYHIINDSILSGFDNSDFAPGPIAGNYASSAYQNRYGRVWKITRQQIDDHRLHYQQQAYIPADIISDWPANGDTGNGEASILAPFYDMDSDGSYEPLEGDYPLIKGDEAVFMIYNDAKISNRSSYTRPLQAEIHLMAYAFDSVGEPAWHNSIFLHYQIFNRSNQDWDSLLIANWLDADIGNASDDLIGSDSVLGLAYSYNADLFDEGPIGFGANPPALGMLNLSASAGGHMYYNNGGSGAPVATTDPYLPADYYQLLNHKWKSGHSLIVEPNGDGYVPSDSGQVTQWAFEEAYNWLASPLNTADKRQVYTNSRTQLAPGGNICYEVAFIYGRELSANDIFGSLQLLKSYAQTLKQHYQNQSQACIEYIAGLGLAENAPASIELYPNPTTGDIYFRGEQIEILQIRLYTASGHLIMTNHIKGSSPLKLQIEGPAGIYLLRVDSASSSRSYRVMKY